MTKTNPTNAYAVPSVSITTARTGASSKANALGMREMQERAYAKRCALYTSHNATLANVGNERMQCLLLKTFIRRLRGLRRLKTKTLQTNREL